MKKRTIMVVLTVVLIFPNYLQAINLTDYTPPTSSSKDAYLTGAFSLDDGNQPQTSYSGLASGYYVNRYYSVPYSWRLRFDGRLDLERGSEEDAESKDGYDFLAHGELDRYFRDTDYLYFGSIDLGYREQLNLDSADDPYAEIGAGVGYGRFYDATPLARAMRIVDDLISYDVITAKVSDPAYRKLAEIIDREDEFESRYGPVEYKKYWYEEMEKVFKEEGVLETENLGALGVVRIEDILEREPFSDRTHGWKVKAGVSYIISDFDGEEGDPALTASFEYGMPFSYKLQFNERFVYRYIFRSNSEHNLLNRIGLTYELSDRIDWENFWQIEADFPEETDKDTEILNNLTSVFRYYLSNKITADARLSLDHFEDNITDNENNELETTLFVGFTLRLL